MKVILLAPLSLFVLLFSCKKENPHQATVPGITHHFVLKKDGVLFNPGYLEVSDPFEYAVSIAAAESYQSNANVYSLMINKHIPVGVYDYETMIEEYSCWFSYSTPNYDLCYITDGTFEIIQQDTVQKLLEMK